MPKPKKVELQEEAETVVAEQSAHKEHLLELLDELKVLNVRSVSDLENLIARS